MWGDFSPTNNRRPAPFWQLPMLCPPVFFPTNLCLCLVLNFPARCLVINGVSFGSTPAGDRGTPSPAPPVPIPPRPSQFRGWRGDRMRQGQGACACRLPSARDPDKPLAFQGTPLPSLGAWAWCPVCKEGTYRSLGMSSGSAADSLCDLGQIASLLWTSVSHLWNGQIELEAL